MSMNSDALFNFLFLFRGKYLTLSIGQVENSGGHYQTIEIAEPAPEGTRCGGCNAMTPRKMLNCFARVTCHALANPGVKFASAFLAGIGTAPLYVSYLTAGISAFVVSYGCTKIIRDMEEDNPQRDNNVELLIATASLLAYGIGLGGSILYHDKVYPWD